MSEQDKHHCRKLEHMYAKAPINQYFKPKLRIEEGSSEILIAVREDFFHSAGAMHGVVYFKALDDATYFAANSIVHDVFVLTARFEIEFIRPVSQGNIRAVGKVIKDDGHRIEALGELFDHNENLVGRGVGYFARSKMSLNSIADYA